MASILYVLVKVWILKVYICYTWWVLFFCWIVRSIFVRSRRESFEFHHVLGQSSSLVTKDIVHHTKLFIQVWWLHRGWNISRLIIDSNVTRDEKCLDKVDHLQRDKQRYRDKVHQRDKPDTSLLGYLHSKAHIIVTWIWIQIPIVVSVIIGPNWRSYRCHKTQDELEQHRHKNVVVSRFWNLGDFWLCISSVLHDLCLVTRIDTDSNHPFCVTETATTQQDLVWVNWYNCSIW